MPPVAPSPDRLPREAPNQPPPLGDLDLFATDAALVAALEREGGGWAAGQVRSFGAEVGRRETRELSFQANESVPALRTHDADGNRIDEVEFHAAWHELLNISARHGVHSFAWSQARPGSQVARAALVLLAAENETGHLCPLGMTHAAVPVLRQEPSIAREWVPRLVNPTYDRSVRPAAEKAGALIGMAMTEKQGGSDVRSNTTLARPVSGSGPGREYSITGHKWFCSAPMCDAFLVLAQAPAGLSCFLLPRWTADGRRNRFFIQRLKPKLGNRSNASAEVEFAEAPAFLVGEEGRGIRTIIEMVNHTRLDCALVSAGMMRTAVVEAVHHARHRVAFGRLLTDQPLMKNVLADLCVESEAATLLAMRVAGASDRSEHDETERRYLRIALPMAKYWICKRATAHVGEALECLGGNGFIEESVLPRLYRECPLNSIWEGTSNVICLDVLRALQDDQTGLDVLLAEVDEAGAEDPRLRAYVTALNRDRTKTEPTPGQARRLIERWAIALQGALLVRYSSPEVADAFTASRLSPDHGHSFGTLPETASCDAIIRRALA